MHRIVWSEEGIADYQKLLEHTLPSIQADYSGSLLSGAASVLLQTTNHILSSAARSTNKSIDLSAPLRPKKPFIPPEIRAIEKAKKAAHKNLVSLRCDPSAPQELKDEAAAL